MEEVVGVGTRSTSSWMVPKPKSFDISLESPDEDRDGAALAVAA
jgi:hypothetical protein